MVLVKVVTPVKGRICHEDVAVFNFDSEAETFIGFIIEHNIPIELEEGWVEILKSRF